VSRRATLFAIAGLAIAVACVLAWRAAWTCDDALISFRYLRHWLAGDGLVFNAGERVEGFSSFAFLLLLAPCHVLGADLMTAANVIGIVATALQLVAIVWLLREAPLAVIAVVAALFATDRIAIVWATGGLETAVHGALVLAMLALQLEQPQRIRTLAALHVALAASRPEGIVFAVVWLAHMGATHRWTELRRALNWFVPLGVVLLAGRLLYYGELVANPYRAKVEGVPTLAAGASYALAFLQRMGLYGVAAVAAAPLVVLGVRAWRSDARWHGPLVLASVFVAVQLAAVVVVGGDYMTDFRLLAPIVGPFYVAIGCLAALAWRRRASAGAAVIALFAAGHAYRQLSPVAVSPGAPPPAEHKQILTIASDQPARFARALGVFADPGDSILADWAGYMAYGHDLRTIDATGLVSPHVTRDFYLRPVEERLPGHARWPTIEFMQREQLTFIFPKINDRPPEDPEIDERSPARRRDYPFLHVTVPVEGGRYLRFFTTLDADALARRARAKQIRTCFRPALGALTCIP
jgi:arabinofuranosyltransferase